MIPQDIFNYFAEQHDLLLTETDYADIVQLMGVEALKKEVKEEAIAFLMYDDSGDRHCRTLTKKDYEDYYEKWKELK
jgi:hypothetical protein